jgi:hypothetical protein
MAGYAVQLISDCRTARRFCEAARARAARFAYRDVIPGYEAVYRKVLEERTGAPA